VRALRRIAERDVQALAGGLAHLCGFGKGGDSCSLRQHFPPVTADFIVPTFTKNVKVGQPPAITSDWPRGPNHFRIEIGNCLVSSVTL
jgi:hypothetical protein